MCAYCITDSLKYNSFIPNCVALSPFYPAAQNFVSRCRTLTTYKHHIKFCVQLRNYVCRPQAMHNNKSKDQDMVKHQSKKTMALDAPQKVLL